MYWNEIKQMTIPLVPRIRSILEIVMYERGSIKIEAKRRIEEIKSG